jgi:hypothetical protein
MPANMPPNIEAALRAPDWAARYSTTSTPHDIPTVIHAEHAKFCARRTQYCRLQVGRMVRRRGIAAKPPIHMPACIQGRNVQCSCIVDQRSPFASPQALASNASCVGESAINPSIIPIAPSSNIACGAVTPTRDGRNQRSAAAPSNTAPLVHNICTESTGRKKPSAAQLQIRTSKTTVA